MRMSTKGKIRIAGLSAALLLVAAVLCMLPASSLLPAAAETVGGTALPPTYEQYLDLTSPKDVAVSETHIAIADGNKIYLYPRAGGKYRVFTQGAESASFGKIQLCGNILYYTDAAMGLFCLDADASSPEPTDLKYNLANFIVAEGKLYGTTSTGGTTSLYSLSLEGQTSIPQTDPIASNLPAQLPMTYEDGTLYYAVNNMIFAVNVEDDSVIETLRMLDSTTGLRHPLSIVARGGEMYFTDETGLYCSDMGGTSELLDASTDYSALTREGDTLYCVKGDEICAYDMAKRAFTPYRITASSDAPNRLSGAVNIARAGDLLVTADAGNRRISVYNLATDSYSVILPPEGNDAFTPDLIATDGDLIAVSSGARIYICRYGDTALEEFPDPPKSNVRGLACVYGSVYYVTDNNTYGKLGQGDVIRGSYGTPCALTADLYGDLYVIYAVTGEVRKFAESEFLKTDGGELLGFVLPEGHGTVCADFEGNLYTLVNGTVYKNGSEPVVSVSGGDYVFLQSGSPALPVSFALGFEDADAYFLFGDYIVKRDVGIPTLSGIDAGGIREELFAPHQKEELLIDIPAGTIGVRTDLDSFREGDPTHFPYSFYYRTAEDMRGLLLASKGDYVLVVLYEVSDNARVFTVDLFRLEPERRQLVPESEYWQERQEVRYLSSAVSAYYFPCLHPALADCALSRGVSVTVLGYVTAPERTYALIEYTKDGHTMSEDGALGKAFGYVPLAYLTEIAPIPENEGKYEPAWLKASGQGVIFTAESGETLTVYERTRAEFSENGDGTYTARISVDGKVYTATVAANMIDRGENDALRISLIVILTVVAVGIVGGYVYLLPRKKQS